MAAAGGRERTDEVEGEGASFEELLLPEPLTRSLAAVGFLRPSPVQYAAIPMARLGADLIVQAKSGTGKTLVYTVAALERVVVEVPTPQVVIVTPTREIAIQSTEVLNKVMEGLDQPMLRCHCFIGGQPAVEDQKRLRRTCQIAVGTPGRLCYLVDHGQLPVETVSLLALDEADQLLDESFREDIQWLRNQLDGQGLQTIALSATFTPEMLKLLESWMTEPQRVMLCEDTVSLKGVKHFYAITGQPSPEAEAEPGLEDLGGLEGATRHERLLAKLEQLLQLMGSMVFHQAIVFCNHKEDGEWLAAKLTAAAFPAAHISGGRSQEQRSSAMASVRGFKRRVLVSTDLTARGVDLEHVNLVINLDLPYEAATLLHRIGRTGRWGSRGVAVTFCNNSKELSELKQQIQEAGGGDLELLPDTVPPEFYRYELEHEDDRGRFEELLEAPVLPDPDEAEEPEGTRPPPATWEEYAEQYSAYQEELRGWSWQYYEWREQYRTWLYGHHMEAASQAYYAQ